jgi:DUF4097 and DUF4098 domain-containing protein YvlB
MRFFAILMLFLLIPALQAQEPTRTPTPSAKAPVVERQVKEFKFYPGGKIDLTIGVPGNLKIVGWKKGSLRLEAEKIVYYLSSEDAVDLLQKSPLRVRHSQTSVTIQAPVTTPPPANMEINLTLYIPGDRTDLKIMMDRGDFSIESINGWVEATIKEGSVEAKSMAGYFSANTLRGDIYAEMTDNRWRGYEFAALTQSGSVELKIPTDFSAALQLETRDGKITIDYPPQEVEGEIVPPEIMISKTAQSLKATVGDGGAPIKIATTSGDVKLSRREEEP